MIADFVTYTVKNKVFTEYLNKYISDKNIEIEGLPNGLVYVETYGDTAEISAPICFLPENWEEREPDSEKVLINDVNFN